MRKVLGGSAVGFVFFAGRAARRVPGRGMVLAALALALAPGLAGAATIQVTTTQQQVNDDADCSLQEAIFAANYDDNVAIDPTNLGNLIETGCTPGDPGTDTVVLAAGQVYQVSGYVQDPLNPAGISATPLVWSPIVLEGNGARLERVGGLDLRAFTVAPAFVQDIGPEAPAGISPELTLRDLHVRGFRARGGDGAGGGGGGMGAGGAVFVLLGNLNVERCTFEDNSATGGNGGTASQTLGGGGGGGLSASATGGVQANAGGGGGGARGAGGAGSNNAGGGGGGTANDGVVGGPIVGGNGGFDCGGKGGDYVGGTGDSAFCPGGGGGGGAVHTNGAAGAGGSGFFFGGGGGGGGSTGGQLGDGFGGAGGFGGFGGGGGAGGSGPNDFGPGGPGGFGGGGGAHGSLVGDGSEAPSGVSPGAPGGRFAGNAGGGHGGGGAGLGGAIFVFQGQFSVSNSTFHANGAFGGLAGGAGADGGRGAGGAIFLLDSAFWMNHGTVSGSIGEGSIYATGEQPIFDAPQGFELELNLYNSIVADHADPMQPNCIVECDDCSLGEFGSNNLDDSQVGNDCVGTTQTGDPQLEPLALYAPGTTPTRRIPTTSPALDNGDAGACFATDQRGVARPQLAGCDIGAYERDTFPTTTTLLCAPNPSLYTQLVTCTATVTATEGGTPTGSVAFAIDAAPVGTLPLDGLGQASFSTAALTVGPHPVDASYLGSAVHDASVAPQVIQVVDPIPTTTALVCVPNPSIYTQLVTCTATVTPTFGALVPTGTVTFAVDAVPQAPVALDGAGQASFSTSSLTVGLHTVDAAYGGAIEFLPSVAPQVVQVVDPIPTATTVVCVPDPSFYAQEVVCTATVVATFGALVPVGDVAIGFDGAPAPTQPLDGAGQASRAVSDLEVGEHAVVASYLGSTNFAPSVSPQFDQTVVKIPTATSLAVAPNPVLLGGNVGFTATVAKTEPYDGLPTGDVVFSIDGVDEPPVPIDGAGVAVLFKNSDDLGPGEHLIGARYLGEPHFEESAAEEVLLRVVTIQEIPTLDASGLAALVLLLAAGALTILVRRRGGHRR